MALASCSKQWLSKSSEVQCYVSMCDWALQLTLSPDSQGSLVACMLDKVSFLAVDI